MPGFVLRIEGVNFSATLDDTNDLSTIRGAGRALLRADRIAVVRRGTDFFVSYEDQMFPVAPRSLDELLRSAADATGDTALELLGESYGSLPRASRTDRAGRERRHRHKVANETTARTVTRSDDDGETYEETIQPAAEEDGALVIRFDYAPQPKGTKQEALVDQAVEIFGEFANLNFPEEWPEERRAQVRAEAKAAGPSEEPKRRRRRAKAKKTTPRKKARAISGGKRGKKNDARRKSTS